MLTIFALPKLFRGEFDTIQRNAIKSWTLLKPRPEIILFADEKGTAKRISEEFGIKYVSKITKNKFGTPLISDIFLKGQKIAKNNILTYINADIILTSDFMKAVKKVKDSKEFLMVGQRRDLNLKEKINFDNSKWEKKLKRKVKNKGKLHPKTGIDYFIFKRNLFKNILPFAVGRPAWDEYFLYYVWKKGVKIIDATRIITAIHQNHQYIDKNNKKFNPWKTGEAKQNLKLAGGYKHCLTISDATHVLTLEGLNEVPPMNIIRKLELMPYLGFFVRKIRSFKKILSKIYK